MVASQSGSQGINWWAMAALSTTAVAPLVVIGLFLERYIVKGLTAGAASRESQITAVYTRTAPEHCRKNAQMTPPW
jgi:hypothetical protein